jgi:hypothetical protein
MFNTLPLNATFKPHKALSISTNTKHLISAHTNIPRSLLCILCIDEA